MEGGPGVDVGGGVKLHDVRRRLGKLHTPLEAKSANWLKKGRAVVATDNQYTQGKMPKRGDRVQKWGETFFLVIIPNDNQDKFEFGKVQGLARLRAAAKALGQVKTREVHGVGNHGDIRSRKMGGDFPRGELGNGGQADFGIPVDAIFQSHDEAVIQEPVKNHRPTP